MTSAFAQDFEQMGGKIFLNWKVSKFELDSDPNSDYPVKIKKLSINQIPSQSNQSDINGKKSPDNSTLYARYVVTAGGLYSDKLAAMTGGAKTPQIVPFRGNYLIDLIKSFWV